MDQGQRGPVTNCAMGSHFVVLCTPFFNLFAGVVQIEEPMLAEPHLQAFQPIEPMHALDVHMPALTTQQHRDSAVAIPHPGLSDLADTLSQGRLLGSAGTVVISRAACRNGSAGSPDRHLKRSTREVDHLASPSRRHSLRRITSCSISLSSVKSATTLRSLPFSSSSCRSFFTSDGIKPP